METGARGCEPFVLMGLRLLPWLQDAYRTDKTSVERYFDCNACKNGCEKRGLRALDPVVRQYMGCGYEPTDPSVPVQPWRHSGYEANADEIKVCPGFACGLPEVIEASDAHMFWSKGQLAEFCDDKKATPALRHCVKVLETENARVQAWTIAESERKGGR